MYRRPKFLEVLLEIRRQMAHEADYDVDLFTEIARSGVRPPAPRRKAFHPTSEEDASATPVVCELTQPKDV
jgi:hypothetical protein